MSVVTCQLVIVLLHPGCRLFITSLVAEAEETTCVILLLELGLHAGTRGAEKPLHRLLLTTNWLLDGQLLNGQIGAICILCNGRSWERRLVHDPHIKILIVE